MKNFYTVGEAAKECGMTAEALRHYDRIGLVSPEIKDKFTGYRYYSADDLVRLNTIKLLKVMSIPLDEIKRLLAMDDLRQVTQTFLRFEEEACLKIRQLNEGLDYMRRVKGMYEDLAGENAQADGGVYTRFFPERKMLAAPPDEKLCAANLWRYHDLFYRFLGEDNKLFTFTEKAYAFWKNGECRLAAQCVKYGENENVITLPAGNYLCVICSDDKQGYDLAADKAKEFNDNIEWHIDEIIITGILKWKYCVQVLLA